MFRFFSYLYSIRPRPFKRLQKFLNIEEEWGRFKILIIPHQFKLLTLGFIVFYPYYKPYIQSYYHTMNIQLQSQLDQSKPITKITESFLKQVVEDVLRDPQIRREGGLFVEDLAKRQIVLDAIVNLLIESVKDPEFLSEAKGLTKYLANSILYDNVIRQDVINLVVTVLRDPEVKYEISEVAKWLVSQEEVRKAFVDLGRNALSDEKMQVAVKTLMANSFYDVLMDKETEEKIKLFSLYMLEQDANQNQNQAASAKGIIDTIMGKVFKGYRGETKENEVKKTLKNLGIVETFNALEERRKTTKSEMDKRRDEDEDDDDESMGKSYFII